MTVGHVTPAGKSVFNDLFPPTQAANLLIRAQLLDELNDILQEQFATQSAAAAVLDISQARVSDLYRGKIGLFTVDMLINLLSRVGQSVEVHTKKAA